MPKWLASALCPLTPTALNYFPSHMDRSSSRDVLQDFTVMESYAYTPPYMNDGDPAKATTVALIIGTDFHCATFSPTYLPELSRGDWKAPLISSGW